MPPVVAAFAVVGALWGGFIGVGAIVATTLGAMVVGGIAGALVGYAFDELLTPDITANSSTYKGRNPVYTVTEGTSIAKAYGRCQLAGNIIRSNDPGEDVLKMIIGHGQGEIDSILSWKINHIEWDHLQGVKWWVDAVASQGSILMWATASVDETFVIDTQTFTWKNARSGTGEVTIGANVGEAVANIVTAITADLTTVTAVVDGWGVVITAAIPGIGGNDIVFTEAVAAMSIDGSGTLGATTAGTDGYLGSDHFKNTLLGTDSQSVIQVDGADLFTLEACAHRGIAHTGFKLKKNSQISGMGSILVEGKFDLCEPIGGGADVFSRNPAVVMWDFYRKIEGYEIAELDIDAFTSLETLCDFYPTTGDGGPIRPPGPNNTTVKATSYRDAIKYAPFFSFNINLPLDGTNKYNQWASDDGETTQQRLNVDLGVPVVLTKIVLVNSHIDGAYTTKGIQNFVIQGSNTAADLNHVTYADGASGWTDVQTGLTATQYNVDDPYKDYAVVTPGTAYRYYSIKIADSHGGSTWMGVRDICFWGRSPRYTFDFNFDTEVNINDAKKLIWSSFNGRVIRSQGKLKPVWDWKTMADGSGGLTAKTSQYSFTMNNIVKGSFTWHPRKRANKIIIEYLDPSEKWKKTPVMEKDDSDIDDRGVIELKSKAYYITQQDVAARRCRRQLYRAMYADYQCELTGFPSSQKLEVYDLVEVTHTLPDWTTKQFIVLDKTEDEQGRPTFLLETYYAGVFDDLSTPIPDDYYPVPPNPYAPSPASTGITTTLVGPGGGYDYCAVKVAFTPPGAYLFYSHTVIYASRDDTTYYCVGESSGEDFVINGMGTLYSLGDTCYVKLTNVSTEGVAEEIPDDYDASVVISEAIQMASFYAGIYDFWGGNAAIGNAATKIVMGNLDGIPKIALGTTADAITFAGTQSGFFVDGDGNLRVGGAQSLKWNPLTSRLTIGEWIVSPNGIADNFTEANATILIDKTNALMRLGATSGDYIIVDGANQRIRSSNYVSGYMGAGVTLEPDLLEVGNIACRGIFRTNVFQKDTISVVGGNVLVMAGDILDADMTANDEVATRISEAGDTRISEAGDTRISEGHGFLTIEGNETFAVGDILRIKTGEPGVLGDDEWLEVTNAASAPTYTVTRDKGADYAANSNPAWTKGAAVVNYGQSGSGGIYMTSSEPNAPYMSIITHAGSPWDAITTHIRMGNLNGYAGYSSDIYGWAAYIDANNYIKIDPANGIRMSGEIIITGGSMPGLTLDDLANGASYGRVATTAISAGKIVLTSSGVSGTLPTSLSDAKCTDANADQTSAHSQAVAWLTDAGALALEDDLDGVPNGANYGKVAVTAISAGKIILSEATGDLDDIANGASYGRVAITAISAGKIVLTSAGVSGTLPTSLSAAKCTDANADQTSAHSCNDPWSGHDLDDLANGTYGKVLTTAISAGKIVLTSAGVSGTLPTSLSAAKCTDANADQTSTHTALNSARSQGNVTTIQRPGGAAYSGSISDIGVIKITLPQSWTHTMMKFFVDIFEYTIGLSFTLEVAGYNYANGWINCTANLTGSIAANNRVRFGHDGTKCCILIGETTSNWAYIKVNVRDLQVGYSNYSVSQWDDGWSVSVVSNISGITVTQNIADSLIDAQTISGQGALATQGSVDLATGEVTNKNLDNIANGASYGRVALTAISAGKIVLTSAGVSGTLPTSLSAAKCTDANADQTSTHTAYDTVRVNNLASTTIILAGKIGTGLVVANSVAANAIIANKISVANLSAISADLGSITAGTITMPSTGWIKGGQTAYATGTGFFLGYSGSAYKFSFGDTTNHIKWNGVSLVLSDGLVTFNNLIPFIAGDLIEMYNGTEVNMGIADWTKKKEIYIARKGTLRIKFEMKGYETYGQIRRNGGIVGTERYYDGAVYQSYSEDIAGWSSGDRVQIYLKKTGGTGDAFLRRMKICSDNPVISVITL